MLVSAFYVRKSGDSLVSRKSKAALNSLVERKSRLLCLTGLRQKSGHYTARAVIRHLKDLPPKARLTLTLDNGTENAGHESITRKTDIKCYFAHPYHSWERGTNENTNSLIRYYLPKGTDFSTITKQHLKFIEKRLNNRPRKCLGFKTLNEVAASCVALHG
jgi:IS30 family transposase